MVAEQRTADVADVERCQLCGSGDREQRFQDGPYRVVECRGCGLVYVTPRLQGAALAAVYDAGYWKSADPKQRGYADYASESALYLRTFGKRMALVRRHLPAKARILDVGCAAGYFLQVARRDGHDVHGVEMSAAIAGEAQRALGSERVHVGTLDEAIAAKGHAPASFDLVTLWDVIEHVPDPQALLRTIRGLLKPGGKLLLETQNVASRWARLLGRRWHHFKHDEHLYHFAPATIRRLLGDCGFETLEVGAAYAGKYVSFGFLAERAGRLGRVAGWLASPLALLRGLSLYANPRDEMIVVARPR
jgi:2-polyprenyl-3-methyl-5-hydroxy-6-metoxy-1,4-benzoquinol methylase